ncbi:unnamed protein product [Kluyveromyces dobzhanskii CBS 2104]|uniref:WGS project CCBQ000000000 data, contig 00017 n=1 Tax=Kluyveromyces dobzhanskii CBS 2104 TaxID=1427455 RepID=A0A0A8L8T7_9SACH|nr:unnamed protein product [Kluyveromyces dobzhanskii CBS 2104]
MDLKEEVLLQVNSAIASSDGGPLLFILLLDAGIATRCFLWDNKQNFEMKLGLFSWKPTDSIGVLMLDPEIYDYDDTLKWFSSNEYQIVSKFHYFPETSDLVQWHEGVRYPFKLINCGIEIQEDQPDLKLLQRDLKVRLERMIQYLQNTDDPSDEIMKEIWLLLLRYKKTYTPDLDKEISELESKIIMMQVMFNQLETNIELY